MEYLVSSLIGYLIGSFPTAFVLLKKVRNIDITSEGSGNVGAKNAFDITKSKTVGVAVLLVDALKGLLSVYVPLLIFPVSFVLPALALFFSIFSHCYNPWLRFKGGRGLTTAAGGTVLLFPALPVVWCAAWLIIYFIKKDIIFANVWASAAALLILFGSSEIVYKYSFPPAESVSALILFTAGVLTIIFIRHIEPLLDLLNNKKN